MAFLNMEQHTWAFTFGILGNIISLMVYLSPLPTFYRVYRKKSTGGFQSTPYVVTLFSCMLWMYYAFLKSGAELLVTINGVGCVIQTLYIAMYLVYAPKSARLLTAKLLLGLEVGLFGLIALVTSMLASTGALRVHVVGWLCVAVTLGVFIAPLSIIRLVIRTKSVEFMPFSLSFFLVLSAVIWFAYGALKKDVFVALPNMLGFVFGVAQMALYMAYRNKNPTTMVVHQEIKLPEHVKELADTKGGAPAEGRVSCGAEVHSVDVLPTAVDQQAAATDEEAIRDDRSMLRPEQAIKPDIGIVVQV